MIEIKNKVMCCGCTACMNICPKKAISMVEDEEGFIYPEVDKQKCVNCGICDKICPILNKNNGSKAIKAYAVRIKDKKALNDSTSGGFFTPIANYVLENNGLVYGVGYDEKLKVVHKCIAKNEKLNELRGSKYVQSDLNCTFSEIKLQLIEGKLILFSGTPCQVAGLKKFLGKEYENLFTIDLVCHRSAKP